MADNLVTVDNNPDLHSRLMSIAASEIRMGILPGYVILGKITYMVMQDSSARTAFLPQSDRANYESTSLIK